MLIDNVAREPAAVDCERVIPPAPASTYVPCVVPVLPAVLPMLLTPIAVTPGCTVCEKLALAVTTELLLIPNETLLLLLKTTVPLVAVCVPAAMAPGAVDCDPLAVMVAPEAFVDWLSVMLPTAAKTMVPCVVPVLPTVLPIVETPKAVTAG